MKIFTRIVLLFLVLGTASCATRHDVNTGFQCNYGHGSFGQTSAAFGNETICLEGTLVATGGVFIIVLFDSNGSELYKSVFDNTISDNNNPKTYFIDTGITVSAGVYTLQYESIGASGSINVKLHN